jgi:hypothetical protein
MIGLDRLTARYLTPLLWRAFPSRRLAALQRFSATELDSGWQLLNALPHFRDPGDQSRLFDQALEEIGHAELFEAELKRQSEGWWAQKVRARKSLIPARPRPEDLRDFLAFFYVGESDSFRGFQALAAAPLGDDLTAVFRTILADEAGHDSDALELLRKSAEPGGVGLPWLVLRQRLRRWKDDLMRALRRTDGPIFASLTVVYFALGGFFFRSLRRRLELPREEQLRLLQDQVADHIDSLRAS